MKLISVDYGPYLQRAVLSPMAKEALLTVLLDKFTAIDGTEFRSYDALLQELLGSSEYQRFSDYERSIPLRKQADEGVAALRSFSLSPSEEAAVREALLNVPASTDISRSLMAKPEVSEADVVAAEQSMMAEYLTAMETHSIELPPEAQRRLTEWYQNRMTSQFKFARQRLKKESHP